MLLRQQQQQQQQQRRRTERELQWVKAVVQLSLTRTSVDAAWARSVRLLQCWRHTGRVWWWLMSRIMASQRRDAAAADANAVCPSSARRWLAPATRSPAWRHCDVIDFCCRSESNSWSTVDYVRTLGRCGWLSFLLLSRPYHRAFFTRNQRHYCQSLLLVGRPIWRSTRVRQSY